MSVCWKCGTSLEFLPNRPLPFRAACDKCHSPLHVCKACKFYQPSKPNECLVPGTEPISDREAVNFCEDYLFLGKGPAPQVDRKEIEKRLFGDCQ